MTAAADRRAAVDGLRWARRLLATEALGPWSGPETLPGEGCRDERALLAYARARGSTVYHAVGTCRMGVDPLAVVGPDLRLRGMAGLRVVDASVMPTMVSANTNAATLMVAEKASDLVLADRRAATVPRGRQSVPAAPVLG
jgi:choline dehydrogenase